MLLKMPMTREIARAIATDAGNRSMRGGNRSAWSEADYNAAVEVFNYHWPVEGELERLERADLKRILINEENAV